VTARKITLATTAEGTSQQSRKDWRERGRTSAENSILRVERREVGGSVGFAFKGRTAFGVGWSGDRRDGGSAEEEEGVVDDFNCMERTRKGKERSASTVS
jgi:hypothetical protein